MYVNSKFTDKKEVTYQDYNDYVFRPPSGKTPYGKTVWSGLASNKYLTHGNLTNTDGKGNSVGFHKVSGATHDSMETNRLVPAVWHTAINPYVNIGGLGYTMGGGTLSIYNNSLGEEVNFQYISHWQFKFRDGSQYKCDVFSGSLYGGQGTMSLEEFDLDNGYSQVFWYSGNTQVDLSRVSAHGDLSSVTYTGYDITMDSKYGTAVTSYEVTKVSARIRVNRGKGQTWYSAVTANNPVVFGNAGITANDILNFNASGYSKYDFNIFVSFEPVIKLYMVASPDFWMHWEWKIEFNTNQWASHQIQLSLRNVDPPTPNDIINYVQTAVTTATGTTTTTGDTYVQVPGAYKDKPFVLDCISEIIGAGSNRYHIVSTAATLTTLTTAGTMTTLTLAKN